MAEAAGCFDRAVALAPKDPDAFVRRAAFKCFRSQTEWLIRTFRNGGPFDEAAWSASFYSSFSSSAAAADLRQAALWSPRSFALKGVVAWMEWAATVAPLRSEASHGDRSPIEKLPDEARRSITRIVAELEKLSEDRDAKFAAGALETLATLRIMLAGDPSKSDSARRNLRRAVALDPSRARSWDLLISMVATSESLEQLIALCEARLKYRKSAWNHIALAKALALQQKWDQAAEQARAAAKLEPDNAAAPILLAALIIRQSTDSNSLLPAFEELRRAAKSIAELAGGDELRSRWREMMLNQALLFALSDQTKEAEHFLEGVLKRLPDDKTAKEIRSVNGIPGSLKAGPGKKQRACP